MGEILGGSQRPFGRHWKSSLEVGVSREEAKERPWVRKTAALLGWAKAGRRVLLRKGLCSERMRKGEGLWGTY